MICGKDVISLLNFKNIRSKLIKRIIYDKELRIFLLTVNLTWLIEKNFIYRRQDLNTART